MEITYNKTDRIHEVRIPRRSFAALINSAMEGPAYNTIDVDMRRALSELSQTGRQVLANTTKLFGTGCGCPAIMAQVNLGVPYDSATIRSDSLLAPGHDVGLFPGQFDQGVRQYLRGLIDAGVEPESGGWMTYHVSDKIRLIAVD